MLITTNTVEDEALPVMEAALNGFKRAGSIAETTSFIPPALTKTTAGNISNVKNIRSPWIISVQQTAINPPKKVYPTTTIAQIKIETL